MIEPIFEIVKSEKNQNQPTQNISTRYSNLILQHCSASYGYYTQTFMSKISQEAPQKNPILRKFNLKKMLRQCCKFYALSDLQLVFVAYFCNLNKWDIKNDIICQHVNSFLISEQGEEKQYQEMKFFLGLVGYFVKSYVGDENDFSIIDQYVKNSDDKFMETYKQWIESSPPENFMISPRELNRIYTDYSKNCQNRTQKKNYNEMVDNIIDLSITYSIIPAKKNENDSGRKRVKLDEEVAQKANPKKQINLLPSPMKTETMVETKKTTNRISLNKKTNNKPNDFSLGYYNERLPTPIFEETRQDFSLNNRSQADFNLSSLLDLRQNRSGSSGLPIPWKPQMSGFFQKSRID